MFGAKHSHRTDAIQIFFSLSTDNSLWCKDENLQNRCLIPGSSLWQTTTFSNFQKVGKINPPEIIDNCGARAVSILADQQWVH